MPRFNGGSQCELTDVQRMMLDHAIEALGLEGEPKAVDGNHCVYVDFEGGFLVWFDEHWEAIVPGGYVGPRAAP